MKRQIQIHGFTLLEMLTALAIIAILIGLLIPAISKISETAHTVKQKAQFHAIGVGLEAFRADAGDYPPSNYSVTDNSSTGVNNSPTSANGTGYCGAQKLAEAMIGWDGFGYHPKSVWRSDGKANVTGKDGTLMKDTLLYHVETDINNFETAAENHKARKGPYIEVEKANAVKLSSIYPTDGNEQKLNEYANPETYALADMFSSVPNKLTGKRTGMPILYYRADTSKVLLKPDPLGFFPWTTSQTAIYNVNENFPFIAAVSNTGNVHPMVANRAEFYRRIVNPNFTNPQRPYRAQSFILLSAGADGMYGTPDDVYNIEENEK